ncbi:Retrovirus-related Pol polyprotein from transposon opus, partial [Araneus ventricosus]
MSDINAVQIPMFNRSDPGLWFVMCESSFALATPKAITESVTKYNYIVSHLPPDSASLIRDVLMKPDATDPYSQIKKELMNRSGESSQHEIRKLLSGEELGKRKPSELLRNMKRRAESLNVADNLMLELFLQRLPSSVQTILAAVSELTLDKAAEIADRIIEVSPSPIETFAVSKKNEQSLKTKLFLEIEKLNKRIDRLSFSRGRSPYRRNKNSRERSISNKRDFSICWDTVFHKLLKEFPSITKLPNPNQPVKHNTVHHIVTKGPPVVAKPRRLAPDRLKIAKSEFQNMMHLGHLRPSKSNYTSPLHMVPKKGTLNWSPVGDYRALNSQTLKDKYPIPCIADFTAELHESKIFSRIDLIKAYHQIPIHPEDIHKTAICTPFGLFESTRMQFGLCNASATFQRFIDEVTRGLPGVYAFVHDILIASKNHEDHYQHLKTLFSRLDEYGLCINVSKCIFGTSTIDFLGFNLSENGIKPLPDKVKCILDFPKPDTLTQLRRFLGMFNFYRCFISKAAHILAPIVQFLEGHTNKKKSHSSVRKSFEQLKWNENAEQAFLAAKNAIAEATLLRHPIPGAQLSLWVDASDVAIGGTLSQLSQGKWEPIAFFS